MTTSTGVNSLSGSGAAAADQTYNTDVVTKENIDIADLMYQLLKVRDVVLLKMELNELKEAIMPL